MDQSPARGMRSIRAAAPSDRKHPGKAILAGPSIERVCVNMSC